MKMAFLMPACGLVGVIAIYIVTGRELTTASWIGMIIGALFNVVLGTLYDNWRE